MGVEQQDIPSNHAAKQLQPENTHQTICGSAVAEATKIWHEDLKPLFGPSEATHASSSSGSRRGDDRSQSAAASDSALIKRDPTQGQLDLAQDLMKSDFHGKADGSYSLNYDGKKYNVSYAYDEHSSDSHGPLRGPVTDPNLQNDGNVNPVVRDANGKLINDNALAEKVADRVRELRSKQDTSERLSQLPLDASQQKAFEGILKAMSASPPDLSKLNEIGKTFSSDPEKFKNVFSAVFDEHQLNEGGINFSVDGTRGGRDITFSSPTDRVVPGWTNIQVNIPSDKYDQMYR